MKNKKFLRKGVRYGVLWGILSPIAYLILGLFAIGGPLADTIAPVVTYAVFFPLFIFNKFVNTSGSLPGIFDFIRVVFVQIVGWVMLFSLIFLIRDEVQKRR